MDFHAAAGKNDRESPQISVPSLGWFSCCLPQAFHPMPGKSGGGRINIIEGFAKTFSKKYYIK
jgi:hypothetical protein